LSDTAEHSDNTVIPGLKLSGYRLIALLGKGGMGSVYLAEDEKLKRRVAVKVISEEILRNEETLARFLREAQMMATVEHPHVVRLYSFGEIDHRPYLIMEHVEGESLADVIRKRGKLSLDEALLFLEQILEALEAAWEKQVIHRDIKPSNILIDRRFRVRVADFGLAKAIEPLVDSGLTATGQILGSPAYVAPEQLLGKPIDFRSDIYSLGILFYEMLTGERPFDGPTPVEVIAKQLNESIPSIRLKSPEIPQSIDSLIRSMTIKNPSERPHSYVQLLQRIRDVKKDPDRFQSDPALTLTRQSKTEGSKTPNRVYALRNWLWLLVPLFIGVGIGVLLSRLNPSSSQKEERPQMSYRYLTYSGVDSEPSASPDGRYVAFTSRRTSGIPRIWVKDLSGGTEQPLTSGPDTTPRFSPDGDYILFTRRTQIGTSLYWISVLGGDPREMIPNAADGDWAPDAKNITFVRNSLESKDNVSSLMIASVNGGDLREITRTINNEYSSPRCSPDGKFIAVKEAIQFGNIPAVIRIFSLNRKLVRTIAAPADGDISSVIWSGADGALAYLLYDAPVDLRRSTARLVSDSHGVRKEQSLFLLNTTRSLDILGKGSIVFEERVSIASLRQIDVNGESAVWLTRGRSDDGQPVFSPDGEWIMFSSARSGNLDLWKISRRTGMLQRLTESTSEDYDPAFSSDGKLILWSSSQGGNFQIWMSEANGSSPKLVTPDEKDAENPSMTPDGKWIVYASYDPRRPGIWKIHPDGSAVTSLVRGHADLPHVSPKGTYVLYRVQTGDVTFIRVVKVEDAAPVPFEIRIDSYFRSGRARWTPDGKAIAFTGKDEKGISGVFVQDFVPGSDTKSTRQKLPTFDPDMDAASFDIFQDGESVIVSYYRGDENLVLASGIPDVLPRFK
jgi:serine/threonine protein kinase